MVRPRNVNKKKKNKAAPNWEETEVFESRTQIKLSAQAVSDLGEELAFMKPSELAQFNFPDAIEEAMALLRRLKKGPAYKRQKAYLGKLLREDEAVLQHIREVQNALTLEGRQEKQRLKQFEQWRERLIEEGDEALADLLSHHPEADRQQLRQLMRQAKDDNPQKTEKARKALFQALKNLQAPTESA